MAYGQYQPYGYNNQQAYGGYSGYQGGYPQAGGPPAPASSYGHQPYQYQQQAAPQQMQTSIAFINGQIEARAYPVAPGNRVYLFDTDGRTYYVKGVDFNGMPLPFKTYDYTETVEQPPQQSFDAGQPKINMADYIRRDEVEGMIAAEVEKRLSAANARQRKGGDSCA